MLLSVTRSSGAVAVFEWAVWASKQPSASYQLSPSGWMDALLHMPLVLVLARVVF